MASEAWGWAGGADPTKHVGLPQRGNPKLFFWAGKSTYSIWATWALPEANKDPPNANRAITVVCKWSTHAFSQKSTKIMFFSGSLRAHFFRAAGAPLRRDSFIKFWPRGQRAHFGLTSGSLFSRHFFAYMFLFAILGFSVHDMLRLAALL